MASRYSFPETLTNIHAGVYSQNNEGGYGKTERCGCVLIALAQDMDDMQMGDAMTNLRLQKMLFFAQGWSLTRLGKPLFEEPIEAWQHGPAVPACYGWYSGFGRTFLTSEMPPGEAFAAEEYELLLVTWTELSGYSTSQLETMTIEKGNRSKKIDIL